MYHNSFVMEKFEKFIKDYDSSKVGQLPKFMKRRLDALKKIQLEHIKLLHEYHKEIQELELKYEKLYSPLYEKRHKIITGELEPNEEDCKLPSTLVAGTDNEENVQDVVFSPEEEKTLESKFKGIPGFWLGCLNSSYNFSDSVESYDKNVLKHLKDIRISYGKSEEFLTYTLEFLFDENPYFTNKVLTKTYYLKLTPDEKDPFNYEGFEVVKSEGCEINWNPGKDITTKTVTVSQRNKRDGRTRDKKKEVERDSFFYFFKPPAIPDPANADDELNALMAVDFELGESLRQSFIPRAPLIYAGHLNDDDDDSDMEDAFSDDDEESIDGSDYDMDDSDESHDSLEKDGKDN